MQRNSRRHQWVGAPFGRAKTSTRLPLTSAADPTPTAALAAQLLLDATNAKPKGWLALQRAQRSSCSPSFLSSVQRKCGMPRGSALGS
ncbi:hypothetical protein K470DRAFT_71437 [Piedraia hortae CBS 480.64]|uniref:Uncharacterized protein n=1 Tax=Piedraia hortae CBS 480.64 TaxID=1314780 RepID=A0A6A7BZ80_9PEZI|nr:hypothetical protein K470DRAFT_71437 [Piedraia hortae CBS 480.64]